MLNQNQNQNQSSYQSPPGEQNLNPYPQSYRKDSNPSNQVGSKYSSARPYQPKRDFRNRERSRSNEHSPRQSYNDYIPGNNMKSQGQNNFNINNRNNKPFYYRQNIERQYGDSNRFKKDKINYGDNYSSGFNMRYNPNKDDCLIIFPNNYFTFNSKDFDELKNELKRELKDDIYNIYYNYCIPNVSEKVFRFTNNYSSEYPLKAKAIRVIADFIFDIMKGQSDKVTYLKLNFLIPENVIGFIIGINGKNINQIREETNAKIEVYSLNNTKNYRKVEISGIPQIIANAAEKIYIITRKYFYFNNEKILNRNEPSPQKERDMRENWGRERNRGDGYIDSFKGGDRQRDSDRKVRYYESHYNKNNNINNNDKEYKGIYNKERYDYKDMGYKNDYKNKEGYRNYGNRDMKKNSRDSWNKNNNGNYNRDNNNDNFRDNGPRYKGGNYDKGNNNKYNYDKDKNIEEPKNDNWSNKSYSKKSRSENSEEIRSPNVENDGEWPEEKDEKKEDNNKQDLELREEKEKDLKDNLNENNNINNEINIGMNDNDNEIKKNGENENNNNEISDKKNNIGVSNIENNNLDNNIIIKIQNEKEKEENMVEKDSDFEEINNVLEKDVEGIDKSCKINIYLSSEEINLLNNSKNDNIWIKLENSFNCNISKIIKNIDNQEISLITFNGTPKRNTLAIYQLQKYLLDTKNEKNEPNKENN